MLIWSIVIYKGGILVPTITVTAELINIIKSERKLRNFNSGDLSRDLKKNTSYISQLENGKISQLDLKIFHDIFEKLIPDETNRSEFVSNLLNNLSVKYSKDEIKKQVRMTNFDLQFRLIPIPEEIIEFLKDKKIQLEEKGFSTKNIIDKVNLNEDLNDDFSDNLKENQIYIEYDNDGNLTWSIKFKLKDDLIEDIINKVETTINYINLLGIVNAIYKLEGSSKEDSYELAQKTLSERKFYTLIERNSIIKQNEELLSKPDKDFLELKKNLFGRISFLGDKDVNYMNKKFSVLLNNLYDELPLTLAIIGVSLAELKEIDSGVKKKFITEYKEMIQRYKNSADEEIIERLD